MKKNVSGIANLILICILGITMILSMLAGIMIYTNITKKSIENTSNQLGFTYLNTKIHNFDEIDAVQIGKFNDVDALYLYLTHNDEQYTTILYADSGYLKELFCETMFQDDFKLSDGQKIIEAENFKIKSFENNLLILEFTNNENNTQEIKICIRSDLL